MTCADRIKQYHAILGIPYFFKSITVCLIFLTLNEISLSFREVSGSYAENQKIMTLRKVYQVGLDWNVPL